MSGAHWTPAEDALLLDLLEAGTPYADIAARLGRSLEAVRMHWRERKRALGDTPVQTGADVARLLGLAHITVCKWIRQGIIPARPDRRFRGLSRGWNVAMEDLDRFIRDPRHWPRWCPEGMTDPALRAYAIEVRRGTRYLTTRDVAARLHVDKATVVGWHRRGKLPAVLVSSAGAGGVGLKFREADVVAFQRGEPFPPPPPRTRACGVCGDLFDLPVHERGRQRLYCSNACRVASQTMKEAA